MPFAKLDRALIVAQALALLKEEGLAGVSLRKVAARLGVSVSSLYWHVRDKQALHALMAVSIFRDCLDAVPPAASWRQWLHDFGLALWDAQIATRDARELIVATRARAGGDADDGAYAQASATRDSILDQLAALGLPREEADIAQRSVQALVTGWTTLRVLRPDHLAADRARFIVALDVLISGWRVHQDAGADAPPA